MGMDVRTLHFRVLGSLEMWTAGRPVRLGGDRQRALLALLLLRANELVTVQQLVDELFGDEPSDGAANAVHVAISRLRRALDGGGECPLLTRPGGYMLELEADQLDARQFERWVVEGRELLADGEPAQAAARLRDALELWRGPPLADVTAAGFVQSEVQRLEELQLLALMERIDADLALGHDAELIGEIRKLVDLHPMRERLRAQLMLALYRSGRQAESLDVYRDASRALREELGLDPGPGLRELERMVLHHDPSLDAAGPARGRPATPRPLVCPFKGLAFFDSSDAEFFCGRERLVSDLIARLAEWPLVGILGPSGIGKSSLLRAGLLPALRAGGLPASGGWRQILLRPGTHPCDALDRAVGDGGLDRLLARMGPGERVVIAVDQLEELFAVCTHEQERRSFLDQLAAAARDNERRVFVVCALRADFYGEVGSYKAFAQLLSQSHVLVGPMDRDELKRAVAQPARRAGLEIEPSLVDALVADVVDEPGGLPLLSTTLLELWQARDGEMLRFESFRTTGGVRGAVSRLAEAAYTNLDESQRVVATSVLLRLAGEDGEAVVRRRVPAEELERIDGAGPVLGALTDARLLTVSDGAVELSHEALLSQWPRYRGWLEEDRAGRRMHSHLTATAREWDAGGRDPGDLYRGARLTGALDWAAQHHRELNRSEREFIDASQVQAERDARRQRSQNRRLRTLLLGTGILLLVSILAGTIAVLKQQQASNDAHLAAAEARTALARQLSAEAINGPRIDVAMLLAREAVTLDRSPQTEGTLLSVLLRSPAVIGTFALPAGSIPSLTLSPNGGTLAVSDGEAGALSFYDTVTHRIQRTPLTDYTGDQPPAYSPDGSLLVYPAGSALKVRDAHTLSLLARLPFDPRYSPGVTGQPPDSSILIAPDGRTVYFAYGLLNAAGHTTGAYIDQWSLPSGRRVSVTRIGSGALLAARLVDSGDRLVVVTSHGVRVYDAHSLRLSNSVTINPSPRQPSAAAISPDGHTVAIGSQAGSVALVDSQTGAARPATPGQGAAIRDLVYSADASTVVSVGNDDRVVVWGTAAGRPLRVATGPLGQVQNIALASNGTTLYTASLDGVMLAWDLSGRLRFGRRSQIGPALPCCQPISPHAPPLALSADGTRFAASLGPSKVGLFSAHTLQLQGVLNVGPGGDSITALAWSPGGSQLAVAGRSGLVQLWAVDGTPRLIRSLVGLHSVAGLPEAVQSISFSPDGKLLAASDENETLAVHEGAAPPLATLALWHVASGSLVAPPRELGLGNSPGGSDVLAFSRDGKLLAVSLLHGGVLVLDATTGRVRLKLADPADDIVSLAFSRNGTLATGTLAGTVDLWSSSTGQRIAPPVLAASVPIAAVAFDPSGRRFATSGYQDGTVKLWSTSTLQQEGPNLVTDQGATSAIAFGPGSSGLVAADDRGDGFVWPTSLATWERRACAIAARNLSRKEWSRFIPELPYQTVCR